MATKRGDYLRCTVTDADYVDLTSFPDAVQWLYDNSVGVVGLFPVSSLPILPATATGVTWDVCANSKADGLFPDDLATALEDAAPRGVNVSLVAIARQAVTAPDATDQRAATTQSTKKKQQEQAPGIVATITRDAKIGGAVLLAIILVLVWMATRNGVKVSAV